jgi:single-strand DNA-binding protein
MWHKVTAAGYLVRDPEMRYTPKGEAVCNFTIGIDAGKDETIWMRVTVWGDKAESVNEWMKKGYPVLVDGKLNHEKGNPRTYVSKKDGQTYANFEMTAFDVRFLPKGGDKEEQPREPETELPWKK